ncbi:DNA polymerase III subunit gamma/tau [Motiliproteus sediminis]|uniref:DNA polymerase III subunit gamma/tau n=1 Tax=Motiliproteus sediminis TaxID=1468178 RepID=UPI001AEF5F89|nr:DNA polymerase III subunit gamma/tau [Motiliproteus sediminis]
MSYQVLARKWRPASFHEMVGQEHVLKALINALDSNRLHHAYLFTGTRGVGKTSIARLFAKALNCEQGVSSRPCGQCSPCREISEGRFVDLIEVDAASRTKVEDTRELLENVQYAPSQGRYKVYLIDEVHMLSTSSFNALLKTLEEPPPHIKFLLATTDPQKLPVTILSRCLQFNLKNMVAERIVEHLQMVLTAEQFSYEDAALWLLARAASGSMRDAMSLADQAIAFCSGELREADVRAMLGSVDHRQVMTLLQQVGSGSASGALQAVASMAEFGADYDGVLAELLSLLHRITLAQMVPDSVDNSQGDRDAVVALAGSLRAEDVQLFYQIALNGRRDLPHVPDPRDGLEMTLLRMIAFRPVQAGEVALPDASTPEAVATPVVTAPEIQAEQADPRPASATAADSPSPRPPVTDESDNHVADGEDLSAYEQMPPWEQSGGDDPLKKPEPPAAGVEHPLSTEGAVAPFEEAVASDPVLDPGPELTAPSRVASLQPEVAAESRVDAHSTSAQAAPAGDTPALRLDALQPEDWISLLAAIGVTGMTYNIAANAALEEVKESTLCFSLGAQQYHLFNDTHARRIEAALSEYFSAPVTLAVVEAESSRETPAQYKARKQRERQAEALAAIEQDPNVQAIIERFDASLDLASVRPLDPEPTR